MLTTNLNEIRDNNPGCFQRYLSALGKSGADDDPITLTKVLDSMGIVAAAWCLRTQSPIIQREAALWFSNQFAENIDTRGLAALDAARAYLDKMVSKKDLLKAKRAAEDAAIEAYKVCDETDVALSYLYAAQAAYIAAADDDSVPDAVRNLWATSDTYKTNDRIISAFREFCESQ